MITPTLDMTQALIRELLEVTHANNRTEVVQHLMLGILQVEQLMLGLAQRRPTYHLWRHDHLLGKIEHQASEVARLHRLKYHITETHKNPGVYEIAAVVDPLPGRTFNKREAKRITSIGRRLIMLLMRVRLDELATHQSQPVSKVEFPLAFEVALVIQRGRDCLEEIARTHELTLDQAMEGYTPNGTVTINRIGDLRRPPKK